MCQERDISMPFLKKLLGNLLPRWIVISCHTWNPHIRHIPVQQNNRKIIHHKAQNIFIISVIVDTHDQDSVNTQINKFINIRMLQVYILIGASEIHMNSQFLAFPGKTPEQSAAKRKVKIIK